MAVDKGSGDRKGMSPCEAILEGGPRVRGLSCFDCPPRAGTRPRT